MVGARAKITVIAGLLFALLFATLGIREIGRPGPAAPVALAARPESPQPILFAVAARAIQIGETLTPEHVRSGAVPVEAQASTASVSEAIGKVAARSLAPGAAIPRTAIGSEDKLALRVPVGKRAISLDTTSESAVAGLIRPGDRVDVQVVYPGSDAINGARAEGCTHALALLQMIEVLAVGQTVVGSVPSQPGGANSDGLPQGRNITLALTPAQVSTLSLAKTKGSLYLSLRNPADQGLIERPAGAPVKAVVRQARPQPSQPQQIELIVGDRRQIIYPDGSVSR